ncbi:hypothetical protein JAAARDRAFT_32143 [Jaapia argillacea MUCL 33604]|uniref:AB hydrolase-1 domain-containing protein n=1 Tax=Jaapia argillacea MUCL 33604 TaxID=933084 RepID=A0A067Q2E0_9AGAM|nr:hypothetical protein JAAARDRAFT_32143 [Jaapia argillacea MUCL 33604]
MTSLVFVLPDEAKLAYEILGAGHRKTPLVLVGGMSSLRGDWEKLSTVLAESRPVLVYDHRGIGDSTYSTEAKDDEITAESMARDLLLLLQHIGWKELAICGFSMGGVVVQQLLFLPYHDARPTPLPFRVTHALLTGTFAYVIRDRRYGLPLQQPPKGSGPMTIAQKREFVRPIINKLFDDNWVKHPDNQARVEWWLNHMASGRSYRTIMKQRRAMGKFNFEGLHHKLPHDMQVLVIHGKLDEVVPFSAGEDIVHRIPWARMVTEGPAAGQVPSYQFSHQWFEYFDISVWRDVIEVFLGRQDNVPMARL